MAPGSRLQELTAKYMQNPRRFFVPLANEYRASGDLDRAIALCREHLPAQPGHMSGHIVLGRAYFEKGDLDAARDVFLTSVSLDDENLIALRHLGDIARGRSDAVDARGWYARVLDADPENREIEQLLRTLDPAQAEASPAGNEPATAAPLGATADALNPAELTSALSDPTPPGLRAIIGEDAPAGFDRQLVRVPDAPMPTASRPLETFDLATLGGTPEAAIDGDATGHAAPSPSRESIPAEEFGITVSDGGGFAFGDLDELVDPSTAGAVPDALPPVGEADFSAGVATPGGTPLQAGVDDLLSRPVFGAFASFASWRTAQERDTPSALPAHTASPDARTPEHADAEGESESGWPAASTDRAGTAPEFVTETMAALYAKQGYPRQAYDVYRALLERTPGDVNLTMKVMQLQAELEAPAASAALDEDADQALEFDASTDGGTVPPAFGSMHESVYGQPTPAPADPAWSPASDAAVAGSDDWFTDARDDDPIRVSDASDTELFGFAIDGLDVAAASGVQPEHTAAHRGPVVALASVLAGAPISAADETAADMLVALAGQMVGRLPKEPPILPVPELLELPSAVAADESTGASPAPLLSFDRFFSGSGAPPRPRLDTPVRSQMPRETPLGLPAASPSLSPTFGGVPVIPPPPPSLTPGWAGFDQFVPPAPTTPASAPSRVPDPQGGAGRTPTGAFWTPAAVPAIPSSPAPERPFQAVSTPAPEPEPVAATEPMTDHPPTVAPAEAPRRVPPSDFHRWLEGLS